MLVNEYRLEIQFKKGEKIRNIKNIPNVRSRPLECKPAQNVCTERTLHVYITKDLERHKESLHLPTFILYVTKEKDMWLEYFVPLKSPCR